MSEIVVEPVSTPIEIPKASIRWRLIPASLLILFGILELILVVVIFGALIAGKYIDIKLFDGPGSPELTSESLSGMGLLCCLGVAWIVAGKLIWRRKFVIGLAVALLAYPLGTLGANKMFSSRPEMRESPPSTTQPQRQQRPPRFDDQRRKAPPPLAIAPFDADEQTVARVGGGRVV